MLTLGMPGTKGSDFSDGLQALLLQHQYVPIPTESDGDEGLRKFTARVNGRNVGLLTDTGASLTVLTEPCARRLRLGVIDLGQPLLGAGGETQGNEGRAWINSLTAEDHEINQHGTVDVLPRQAELNVDGVMGFDLLRLNAAILPIGGDVFFIRPGPASAFSIESYLRHSGFLCLPLEIQKNRPLLEGTFNGRPFRGLVDSGAPFSVVETNYLKSIRGGDTEAGKYRYIDGVDGRQTDASSVMPRKLTLGGYRLPPVKLTAIDSPSLRAIQVDVLIGYDILAAHQAVIDTGRGVLWMR
jgi:predicted aspartyl protease